MRERDWYQKRRREDQASTLRKPTGEWFQLEDDDAMRVAESIPVIPSFGVAGLGFVLALLALGALAWMVAG